VIRALGPIWQPDVTARAVGAMGQVRESDARNGLGQPVVAEPLAAAN
jgi:hypothetical protein